MRGLVPFTVLLALGACKKPGDSSTSQKAPPVPPIKVTTTVAAEGPTPNTITLTGMIAADQRSDVTADTQGKVINVMIERGQRVKLGQAVVQLDVRSAALGAREAQANLEAMRAQKTLADQECGRTKALLDKGAITQSEYDRQMTQCTAAQQQVSAGQARAEMMSKSVNDGLVRAPFDGVISEKMVSPGEWVAPGKPLFTLVKDDPLKIELSVPEKAVGAVKEKADVELSTVAYPDKTYHAMVSRVGAEIGRTRSLIVEATLDKGSGLTPGMFAEAHLVVGDPVTRVILPEDAVVQRGKQWHAFVVKDGEVEDRIVARGVSPGQGQVAIASGLTKGEKVVTKIPKDLADGAKVTE